VIVGKRNLNCLSCGIKDGQSTSNIGGASNINGKDGRVYRGFTNNFGFEQESHAMT
jgi:hypothetical protein